MGCARSADPPDARNYLCYRADYVEPLAAWCITRENPFGTGFWKMSVMGCVLDWHILFSGHGRLRFAVGGGALLIVTHQ